MLIGWLSALAFAGCPPLEIDGSLPFYGAWGVPADQPIMVVIPDGPCAADLALAVVDAGGRSRVLDTVRDRAGATWVYRAVDVPLAPDADYALVVFDGRTAVDIPFTVGSDPYIPQPLSLSLSGTEVLDPGNGSVASIQVRAETPDGNLLHFTGQTVPESPAFATLSDGGSTVEVVQAEILEGVACIGVRAESPLGERTPWVQACEVIEDEPPIDTGEPPLDTGEPPIDTGDYEWEDYYGYGTYGNDDEFVLFSCGGCQSTPAGLPAALLPLGLLMLRRRRRDTTIRDSRRTS